MIRQSPRYCAGCEQITTEPVLIRFHEHGSGPGGSTFACPACVTDGRVIMAPELAEPLDEARADR